MIASFIASALLSLLSIFGTDSSSLPACPTEDSTMSACHWNAQTQGNNTGESFTQYDHGDIVIYTR